MVYLYDACDQISDFCHQQLLRKMRRKISWTDGRTEGWKDGRTDGQTDRGKTVYPPPPSGSGGIINKIAYIRTLFKVRIIQIKLSKISYIKTLFLEFSLCRVWVIQVNLMISYIGTLIKVQFMQDSVYSVFGLCRIQLDFEIFRTIASFINISSWHSLINKLIFIKFFRTIWEIGGQMSWDRCLAESL
jgi:hypothetical protein